VPLLNPDNNPHFWSECIDLLERSKDTFFTDIQEIIDQAPTEFIPSILEKLLSNQGMFYKALGHLLNNYLDNHETHLLSMVLETSQQATWRTINGFKIDSGLSSEKQKEYLTGLYCKVFFTTVLSPFVEKLDLVEKIRLCQQWLYVDLIQERATYYTPKTIQELILPSLLLDNKYLDKIHWNEISDEIINSLILYADQAQQDENQHLSLVILRKIIEKNIFYFLGKDKLFFETLKNCSPYFILKNFLTITSFITSGFEKHLTSQALKDLSYAFRPYEQLVDIPWDKIHNNTIDEIVKYAQQSENKNFQIAILKGLLKHKFSYIESPDFLNKLDNNFIDYIISYAELLSDEKLKQYIFQRIVAEKIDYFDTRFELFLTLPIETIKNNIDRIVIPVVKDYPKIELQRKHLNKLLMPFKSSSDSELNDIAYKGMKNFEFEVRQVLRFNDNIDEYFYSIISSVMSQTITLKDFAFIFERDILPRCKEKPQRAFEFLEIIDAYFNDPAMAHVLEEFAQNDTICLLLASLANVALTAQRENTMKLSVIIKFSQDNIVFRENFYEFSRETKKNKLSTYLKKCISGEFDVSDFFMLLQSFTFRHMPPKEAQDLLLILNQGLTLLDRPKSKSLFSQKFFQIEFEGIKLEQDKIDKCIDEKNTKIKGVLKEFSKNNQFCETVASLVNVAGNRLDEDKKCSDSPVFKKFYSNQSFKNNLATDMSESFKASEPKGFSLGWG
jgi:hypothetical protein